MVVGYWCSTHEIGGCRRLGVDYVSLRDYKKLHQGISSENILNDAPNSVYLARIEPTVFTSLVQLVIVY